MGQVGATARISYTGGGRNPSVHVISMGSVPAYDILRLEKHEGRVYDQDLTLWFGSSGDSRNLIKSVIGLFEGYTGTFTSIVNDQDLLLVLRNVMVLIASMLLPRKRAEFMLHHLWYSARLTHEMVDVISHIRTLITAAKERSNDHREKTLCRSTWNFGPQQLSLNLHKDAWPLVLRMLSPKHITSDIELGFKKPPVVTEERRRCVMLTPHLLSHREFHLFDLPSSQRLSAHDMRENGILSPFESDVAAFTHANPTLCDIDSSQWLQHYSSDPRTGYSIAAVLRSGVEHGVPRNDIYGSLYINILSRLSAFSAKSADTIMNTHLTAFLNGPTIHVLPVPPPLLHLGLRQN